MNIAIFYGSSTCYTEIVSEKIAHRLSLELDAPNIELHNIKKFETASPSLLSNNSMPAISIQQICNDSDLILFGISTWNYGELQEDWNEVWEEVEQLDLNGKVVALFGLGDQIGYTDYFLDALGALYLTLQNSGAYFIGFCSIEGYQFEQSKALTNDKKSFVGLAIDEDNQYDLTDNRIEKWCQKILNQYKNI